MKKIDEIMTRDPACVTPGAFLTRAAELMEENDCGEIPVVDDDHGRLPVGVITDRDIVCRAVAEGKNPAATKVGDIMSAPCITASEEMGIEECLEILEKHQIRRLPLIDKNGRLSGIVAQADIARYLPIGKTGKVLQHISK